MSHSDLTQEHLKLGIIGNPLTHSLSPQLHAFFMNAVGLQGQYDLYPTEKGVVKDAVLNLQAEGLTGINVTIPHKVSAAHLADQLSEDAHLTEAVNTLHFKDGKIRGYNTDVAGFLHSIPDHVQHYLQDKPVLVVGCGGAARAVICALIQLKVSAITLAVRSTANAVSALNLGERINQHFHHNASFSVIELPELEGLKGYEMVVNATPVGLPADKAPVPQKGFLKIANPSMPLSLAQLHTLNKTAYVYDLVYDCEPTEFIRHSSNIGLQCQDGLAMLAHQGAYAFQKWTGRLLSRKIIDDAIAHLRNQL